ncbi:MULTISPECIES: CdaR family protein [Staphylococcus]|uniref:CdaR family protein n=1 Tax=Staphylococcus hsinchuensis TaxID=3051183 RepID=A0ABZ3ECU9_9STAP|nr:MULTISPECIES: CdaR family protein [unclassified Staphylococcus]
MLESKWGLRLIALVLALVFVLSVNNVFGNIFDSDRLGQKSDDTIQDVPVQVKYDNKTLYANNVPKKVDVEISGPQSQILQTANSEDIKAIVDLRDKKAGKHTVQYKVNGLNKDIDYKVKPKEVAVNLEKKVSKTMKVEPDVSNNDLSDNYRVKKQEVSPDHVRVTGGKEQIDKIAYLKATYKNNSKISKDTTDDAKITAFDRNLNKINVLIDPEDVKLKVNVDNYSKKVKVKPHVVGELDDNKKLDKIELSDKEVEIFGNRKEIEDINSINANVNVNGITDTTNKQVQFDLPDKVSKVNPEDTDAKVIVK